MGLKKTFLFTLLNIFTHFNRVKSKKKQQKQQNEKKTTNKQTKQTNPCKQQVIRIYLSNCIFMCFIFNREQSHTYGKRTPQTYFQMSGKINPTEVAVRYFCY